MNAKTIIAVVAAAHKQVPEVLRSKTRTLVVVAARQRAMYEIRVRLGWPYQTIGRYFKRHHSTVIKAIERVYAAEAPGGVCP